MDREQFRKFFEAWFDPVRNFVYYHCGDKELSTDIAQEVFIKVWEKKFDINDEKIKGLVYKMAREMTISAYRHSMVEKKYMESLKFEYEESGTDIGPEYNELKERYEKALARLPEKQREVFLMSRNEELKYSEIAERLSISVKAVEKRMTQALSYLRKSLNA